MKIFLIIAFDILHLEEPRCACTTREAAEEEAAKIELEEGVSYTCIYELDLLDCDREGCAGGCDGCKAEEKTDPEQVHECDCQCGENSLCSIQSEIRGGHACCKGGEAKDK